MVAASIVSVPPPLDRIREVFISYSHKDERAVRRFVAHFEAARDGFGLAVFFDRKGVRAGDEWSDLIATSLQKCQLFLFFLSVNSLNSAICMKKELLTALDRAKAGQCRVVPIVLAHCDWANTRLPDESSRTMDVFSALPDTGRPILSREGMAAQDAAWMEVVQQLRRVLADPAAPLGASDAGLPATARDLATDLLPYYCDQDDAHNHVREALRAWVNSPLVVAVRGNPEDCPDKFIERIRRKDVSVRLKRLRPDFPVRVHYGMQWPHATWPQERYDTFFTTQLAERLYDDPYLAFDSLRDKVAADRAHIVLNVGLPCAGRKVHRAAIAALCAFLGRLNPPECESRIVLMLWTEDETAKPLDLHRGETAELIRQRGLIAPPALVPMSLEHIRLWCNTDDVRTRASIPRERLEELFGNRTVRMREFARMITPLLRE